MATTYRVAIAAGTKSAIGGVLAKPVAFTFETPAPQIVAFSPNTPEQTIYGFEPQRVDVPMFALFDQRVDPAAALAHVVVHARGGKPLARALASRSTTSAPPTRRSRGWPA